MNRYILSLLSLLFFVTFFTDAQNLTGVKILVNPGHGGYDSDDRNVVIAPYTSGDQNGFWESKSNLDKGLYLRSMLQNAGATVIMSRTTNTTADDLALSKIVAMANEAGVDFMLSIHSNAGSGTANYVLQIHYGADLTDTNVYDNYNPNNAAQKLLSDKSREITTEIAKNQYSNKLTTWSSGYQVRGDKTFARTIMGWSDGYGVLRGLSVPGTISEGMMHDYIPETYRLMNMDYKWLEAWHFFKSFCTYFNGGAMTTGNIAGQVRDSRIKLESTYNKFVGQDQMLPLNGATITLTETGEKYTVDQLQNGVFLFKNLAPGTYHLKAECVGYHSQIQEITVTANNVAYFNFALNRVRNTAPQVVSYTPNVTLTDSVEASTDIVLNFNWDMDEISTKAAFSISPTVSGTFTFEDTNYRMRFTPDKPLDKATVYTVKLNKTASHPDGLSMTEDFSFQFLTKNRNRLALLASNPYNGNQGVYNISPYFRLIFDKKLNTTNLQTSVRVVDENGNVLAKTARSVVNNSVVAPYGSTYFNLTSNLTEGKMYKLIVDGNVEDEVGMKLVEPIEINFKATNVQKTAQQIVDPYETVSYSYTPALSSNVSNAAVVTTTTKLFGSYANKLTATYTAATAEVLFGLNTPLEVSSDKVIGLHIFGDLSGNEIWLKLAIPGGEQWVKLCNLNFYGWEFHEADLSSLLPAGTWMLTGIKIKRNNSYTFSASNDISFDNMLLYDAPIMSVKNPVSDIIVYPNPAADVVRVSGVPGNMNLQLFSISGQKIYEQNSNEMNLKLFATGTYILKINAENESYSQVLIISRP